MPSPAKKPIPATAESPSAPFPESPLQVTVVVNGRPISVTIAEGAVAETRMSADSLRDREGDHPPDLALDYLAED